MKKHWLQTLVVFCLGVATVPGVLMGTRWWRNSEGHTPKFVDIQNADAKTDSKIDVAVSEPDELESSPRRSSRPIVSEENPFADTQLTEPNSAAAARAKPVQVNFDFEEVEPPVLAQNSPNRKPAAVRESFDEFEAPAFRSPEEPEPVRAKLRSTPETAKPEQPDGIESLVEGELSDEQKAKLTTLREKLAELTKAKAELVNEQTLEETIFALEKQISDLHAAQKLLSAQQILRALAEEFPDSPAAAKANRMLEAAESKKSPRMSAGPL